MQGLFKFNRMTFVSDAISDCAKNLKDVNRLKLTYPPKDNGSKEFFINIKA